MRQRAKALFVWTALVGFSFAACTGRAAGQGNAAGNAAGNAGGSRVQCFTSYDSEYFYIAAVVQKPNLAGTQAAPFGNPIEDDAVAVFLQAPDGTSPTRRSDRSVEMAVSAAGGAQLYRGSGATPLKGFDEFLKTPEGNRVPFKYAVQRRGQLNREGGENTAYTVEMSIPWIEMGGPPKVGQRYRFNVISYSKATGSSPILSLAPAVKTAEDVQNPSLWSEIAFVEAPVRSIASAPQAKVSARVFNARPLINGEIGDNEWNTLTTFAFNETGGGTTNLAPPAIVSRVRPKVTLRRARPAILPPKEGRIALPPHTPQTIPHLVFALYNYDFQNDTRKSAPLKPVRTPDGASLLASHPLEGAGPWMTYDRVDWHRKQLQDVRKASIDVILPVFRADSTAKQRYALRGLMTLSGALRNLDLTGQDYPLVACYLDTTSLADERGEKLDLSDPKAQAKLFVAIREFYQQIPTAYRLGIPLSAKNGGGSANVVVLSSGDAFAKVDPAFLDECRRRFASEFGNDLLILGGSDFKGKASLDGYVNDTHGRGFQMDDTGWIKPASVGVGYDETMQPPAASSGTKEAPIRLREEGRTYKAEWKQALARKPDWIFIDGWNDFAEGAEIAPSFQNGLEYVDLTRLLAREFSGTVPLRATFLNHTVPSIAPAGATYAVTLRVQNNGLTVWAPGTVVLIAEWQKPNGTTISKALTLPLSAPVIPGQAITMNASLPIPTETGDYVLKVDMAQTGKKGDVTAYFGAIGGQMMAIPLHVTAANDTTRAAYAITVLSHNLPSTMEAGGTYSAVVTVRNDGAQTWKKGAGGRIQARVWRYISPVNSTGEEEQYEPLDVADAGIDLPTDVAPGQTVTVTVPLTFSREDGTPLATWTQADSWHYQIRWEYSANEAGTTGGVSDAEAFALTETDLGGQFTNDLTPRELPGDRRVPVKLSIRNRGPQTWLKDMARVGYHWYYLDGTEAVWQDETTPIPQDVDPGSEVSELLTWITPPPNDGTYWLVWDLKVGDQWASTLPSIRVNETHVLPIQVVHGKLQIINLDKFYNIDGIAGSTNRADGDFDGNGRSFPAELVPPFVEAEAAPSTMWLPVIGSGLDATRRISFHWGPKSEKDKNMVRCAGQVIPIPGKKEDVYKTVHILAAATKDRVPAELILGFADGSQQFMTFPTSRWDAPPTHGEEIAYRSRYSRNKTGDDLDKPVVLYRYTVKLQDKRRLISITLPNEPALKIAAISVEK